MTAILLCLLLALAFAHLADRADARRRVVTLSAIPLPLSLTRPTRWRRDVAARKNNGITARRAESTNHEKRETT